MKKGIFAICMAAVMLTGCGSTAGSSESSKNDAPATTAAAQQETEAETEAATSQEDEEVEYYDWYGIDMPIPSGMEISNLARRQHVLNECWEGGEPSDMVFYSFDQVYSESEYLDESQGHTLEELPELKALGDRLVTKFNAVCQCAGRVTVDSSSKETFMGHEVLCVNGTVVPTVDDPIHIKIYYGYLDNAAEEGYKHIPSCWYAFTQSNDAEALEMMENAADLPLTKAKLHE
ncbi:MAG: hypothetical protein J6Y71_04310 [Ruminococcus sp.]|uniref:hypothetical protein n=1 Tax=Ruminococcus sp. TaxID=41978 RepID=UPI001B2AEC13|nr:hypothetical protein [Ruminococcus sp.]MBO7473994.1 hypothetical protein [Ruminococcus sp.]MBP5362231.1 hypothetical protein [Ruminococcus sp.]